MRNLCPACGTVDAELSSRYCTEHLRQLLASCLDRPAEPRQIAPDPMDWLEQALTAQAA